MVSLNSLKNYGGIQLRDIHRGEDLCIPFDLYNFLVNNQYKYTFDFDIFLPTKGFNLQRPYIWNDLQKEELIWSCIYGRDISKFIFIKHESDTLQIIDGKQRLLTLKYFMENKFPIHFKGRDIYWRDLDQDAKYHISNRVSIRYNVYYSYDDQPITDDEKILIFSMFNFSGTLQDKKHRLRLLKAIGEAKKSGR